MRAPDQYTGPLGTPPPITARPDGLLSLLGLQTQGRFPQHLAYDWLLPTLDLTRWYLEAEQDFPTISQSSANALGFLQFTQVPQDQAWVFLGCSLSSTAGLVAARMDGVVRGNSTAGAGSFVPLAAPVRAEIGQAQMVGGDAGAVGQLLRPLTTIGTWSNIAATAVPQTLILRVVRLQIS